jgi:plasmid stabilization system protein ParE
MTYRIIVEPRAVRDLWAAAEWIETQAKSSATALRWVRGIRREIETLRECPLRCPVDPDSAAYGEGVRVLLYGKRRGTYRVLFAVRGATVHVLTVRHAARQRLSDEMGLDEDDDEPDRAR